jgi:predicted GTPase
MPPELPSEESVNMVIVMGVTGAGKSHLVNKLAGEQVVKEGDSLNSCKILPQICLLSAVLWLIPLSRHQ